MAVQGGVCDRRADLGGVCNLPDVVNPRRLFAAGCVTRRRPTPALAGATAGVLMSLRSSPVARSPGSIRPG
jgi:hypothetical protein